MLKQLLKKMQKIQFNIFCFYSIIRKFTRYLFSKNIFRKLIKFSLIFCIQNKKNIFSAKKWLYPKVNLFEQVHVKKKASILEKI